VVSLRAPARRSLGHRVLIAGGSNNRGDFDQVYIYDTAVER
jgi:hypothetical protein